VTIRARLGDDGVHHFEVNHNFEGNDFRLLSCNIGGVPKKASCHPDLAKAVRSRKETKDGEGKGRAVILIQREPSRVLAVMIGHVENKRLKIEVKVDPDASHGLIFAALAHFTTCAQKLAADMNDGDETFQIGVGKGQKSLRQAVTTLGMTKVEKAGMYEFLHAQELFERRADQRVADASRSRSKARR
jgi:hypothetical protein